MGNKLVGIVILLAILGIVNLLSYLFHWGFWLY